MAQTLVKLLTNWTNLYHLRCSQKGLISKTSVTTVAMSVAGVTRTKKNPKEERGRGNKAYVEDKDILRCASPEQPNASEISKQKHNRKDTTYQTDQSSEVTDVEVTMIGDVELENSSPDGVDDTTSQMDDSPRYDDQINVSESEQTGSGRHQEHEADIEADHDVEENGDNQTQNTDASGQTTKDRDPENGRKRSETTSIKQHFVNHAVAVICLLLCVSACLVYIASIFLTVSCLWGLSPDVSDGNVIYSKENKTITCDPYESQENIPYNLIDLLLALQPIVVIVLWKYGDIAERIEKYEEKREKNTARNGHVS